MSAQPAHRSALVGWYLLYFMAVGISLPFLPGYFRWLGLSGTEAGALLSVGPLLTMVMPPLLGQLADRTRRPGLLLACCATLTTVGYWWISTAHSFNDVALALAFTALFSTSLTPLGDSLAIDAVVNTSGGFSTVRRFGSLGFVLTALPLGFFLGQTDRFVVRAMVVVMGSAALWAWATVARVRGSAHLEAPAWREGWALLRRRDVLAFVSCTALHWMAATPYHGSLAPLVASHGWSPSVVGLSSTIAVLAELGVMVTWARWGARWSLKPLLMVSFGVSAVRWLMVFATRSPEVLILSNVLHALTFGTFYLAAVEWMARLALAAQRATAQALFASVTFGVGGTVGFRVSGVLFDAVGGHALFGIAALAALVPAVLMSRLTPPEVNG